MFDGRWRSSVERVTGPVGQGIGRTGLTADHLTGLGLALAVVATVAVGSGRLFLGAVLFTFAAIPDLLDGAVAKASGTASPRGAFFDSVADRVTDMAILGGIAWYLAGRDGGHAAMLPMAAMGVATLVSYERARAEGLGYKAKGGLMERAERTIAIIAGLVIPGLLIPVLWVMVALTSVTAVHRFVMVWRQASQPAETRRATERRTWADRAERWRAWREQFAADARQRPRAGRERSRRRSSTRP